MGLTLHMKSSSTILQIVLGQTLFELEGLSQDQIHSLAQSWGPFLKIHHQSSSNETESTIPLQQYLVCFKHDSVPDKALIQYRRLDDLAIILEPDHHRPTVYSWVDGSLGSIEATLQVILQWSLQSRGGVLVHASAGIYQGQGILVPGESGAGKSTIAREAGFDRVLSDEMVIVEPDQSSSSTAYQLYSTPFWSEGRTLPMIIDKAPLKLIAFPHKSNRAKLSPCHEAQAVRQLLRAITVYERQDDTAYAQQQLAGLFELSCALCSVTPHVNLDFPKQGTWAATLLSQILR